MGRIPSFLAMGLILRGGGSRERISADLNNRLKAGGGVRHYLTLKGKIFSIIKLALGKDFSSKQEGKRGVATVPAQTLRRPKGKPSFTN